MSRSVTEQSLNPVDPGLCVFLLPREILTIKNMEIVTSVIERAGFEVIETKELTQVDVDRLRHDDGAPDLRVYDDSFIPSLAAIVVAYDVAPIIAEREQTRHPMLRNTRLVESHFILKELSDEGHCVCYANGPVCEPFDLIDFWMPEKVNSIFEHIRDSNRAFQTSEPVHQVLTSHGRRAKTEVIEFEDKLAVKKTFKSHQRRFVEREATAMRELSRTIPEIPVLLEAGECYVVFPYFDDVLRYRESSPRLMPLRYAKRSIVALRKIFDAGYAVIDAHPLNVIVDREDGLKLVDFEFLHRYDRQPASFEQCFDIAGCPPDFDGDQPTGGGLSYMSGWYPFVGLTLDSLLHDPAWLQRVKRLGYLPRRWRHWLRGQNLRRFAIRSRLAARIESMTVMPGRKPLP